ELAQAFGGLISFDFAGGDSERQFLPLGAVAFRLDSIQPEENDACAKRRALVAVNDGVVAANVEEIRGGYFGQFFAWGSAGEGRLRCCHGGLDQGDLPQMSTVS